MNTRSQKDRKANLDKSKNGEALGMKKGAQASHDCSRGRKTTFTLPPPTMPARGGWLNESRDYCTRICLIKPNMRPGSV